MSTTISSPDFTMADDCCKVENEATAVLRTGQVVKFDAPVYLDTLDITTFGSTINTPYVKNIDWEIRDSDIDYKTMAKLQLEDINFTKVVITSFTSLRPVADKTIVKLAMSYQRVYPFQTKEVMTNGQPVKLTATLIKEMISKMEYLTILTSPVNDVHSTVAINSPRLLEPDPHKQNTVNKITGEKHYVNVPSGKIAIHPICGCFFRDSVRVSHQSTDAQGNITEVFFNEGTDYIIEGLDFQRTGYTQNASGVYHFIFMIASYVGDVTVSYHAYGGEATIFDQRILYEGLNNVITYIDKMSYLTSSELENDPTIKQILHEQYHLGENMRRLLKLGKPSYGDTTTSSTYLRKLTATDTKVHWWTIASLYKVDTDMGKSEVITADEFRFRFSSSNFKIMFEATVSVNLGNEFNKFSCTINGDCPSQGYKPFEDYSKIELFPKPQLRIIYNENGEMNSGVLLQIGMNLPGSIDEIVAIEDISGKESCWKLPTTDGTLVESAFEDDVVQLPNTAHIWDLTNANSKVCSTLVPYKDGHLIWAGAEPLNRNVSGKVTFPVEHFLDSSIDIKSIRRARVEFEEEGGYRFAQEMPFIVGVERKVGNASFFYNGSQAYVNLIVNRDAITKKLNIDFEANISAGTSANVLNAKHIIFFA